MKYIFMSFIITLSTILLASVQWPLRDSKIKSTFGESRWDHFHDGIDIISSDGKVYPVDDGALVFYWDKSLFPLDNYPGGGNYIALRHEKSYSVYMHLEDGAPVKNQYSTKDILGYMGNTGHSFGKHLHFTLLNDSFVSINPIPGFLKISDVKPPEIGDALIRTADKYVILRNNSDIRLTKHYPLLVSIRDSAEAKENLGILKLRAEHNGKVVLETVFGEISYNKKGLTLSGKNHDNLFDEKGYYRIEGITYADGENTFTVTATDHAGNETSKTFIFNIKLDISK